jgi:amino acid permease
MLPLSLLRDINSLRYASLVGFLATIYLVVAILIYACANEKHDIDPAHKIDFNFWSSLTVFSFSYCCQTNAFEIYHELKMPCPKRMRNAGIISMSFCTALYIISGISGLAAFGTGIESNILANFKDPQNTPYVLVAFICIAFTVTMAGATGWNDVR